MTALAIYFSRLMKMQAYVFGGYLYTHSQHSKWKWLKRQIIASTSCHSNCISTKHIPTFLKTNKQQNPTTYSTEFSQTNPEFIPPAHPPFCHGTGSTSS